MSNFEAKDVKFRASQISLIMGESRDKNEIIGQTAKSACIDAYLYSRYGIEKEISSKYFEKGNKREELGITYLSMATKKMFSKNETRLYDEYITGLPDLFDSPTKQIQDSETILDIKNAWSMNTFLEAKKDALSKDRYWQGQAYMRLSGAKEAIFAICCVNAPIEMIMDERRKLQYKLGILDDETPEYIEGCLKIERRMIFDLDEFKKEYPHAELYSDKNSFVNIPWKQRIIMKSIQRNEFDIELMEKKVLLCRAWIQQNLIEKEV